MKTFLYNSALNYCMNRIGDGAEAIIYKDRNIVLKDRIIKKYRIKEIDIKLRKYRTRREAKVLDKLKLIGVHAPNLISIDDKKMKIKMGFINGEKVRDVLNKQNCAELAGEIGKKLAVMHSNDIIHGDLTTSNMIFNKEIYFIDFGLSFFSNKIEDKAVDIHLLRRALDSKHHFIFRKTFKEIIKSYKRHCKESDKVLERLKAVEKRGRYAKK